FSTDFQQALSKLHHPFNCKDAEKINLSEIIKTIVKNTISLELRYMIVSSVLISTAHPFTARIRN
ncbi:hypothetical protein MKW98_002971, partial [Papaver atlanticum]